MHDEPMRIDPEGLISLSRYAQIRDWCNHLRCTEVELAEAIAVVGYSPGLVRLFLANSARKRAAEGNASEDECR